MTQQYCQRHILTFNHSKEYVQKEYVATMYNEYMLVIAVIFLVLHSAKVNCLLNPAIQMDPTDTAQFLATYPGQKYSADEQCQLLYGTNSFYCGVSKMHHI